MAAPKIVDLVVQEISLVSEPANVDSKVALYKSATKMTKAGQSCRICETKVDAEDRYCKGCGAPFYKHKEKSMPENTTAPVAEPAKTEVETPVVPEEVTKAVSEAEKANTELAKAKEALAKAEADAAAARAELEKTAKEKAELVKAARLQKAQERVTTTMKSVPADAAALAADLVALEDANADVAKRVEAILSKASALIEKGGLAQVADTTTTAEVAGSAVEQIERIVAQKRAENPKLTLAKAEALAWIENPQLVKQNEQETKAGK